MKQNTVGIKTTERPYFFDVGGSARFAVFHESHGTNRGAFLFCHPLFEEKLWAHRAYVSFARRLAEIGYSVLRMDLRGTGDSDQDFGQADLDDFLEDLEAGWRELGRHCTGDGIQGVFGLRLGGTMAIALSRRLEEVNVLLLWDPVLDTARYLQDLLRTTLTGQLSAHGKIVTPRDELISQIRLGQAIDIEGYALNIGLYDSLEGLSLDGIPGRMPEKSLLVQIDKSPGQSIRQEYTRWQRQAERRDVLTAVEEPFWREIKTFYGSAYNLEAVSLAWLENKP